MASSDPAADFALALANALPTLAPANIEQLVGVLRAAGVDNITKCGCMGLSESLCVPHTATPLRAAPTA